MKKDQIEIGAVYVAKVSGRLVEVRIERENPRGGWDAVSLATNKAIRIKGSQQLRRAADPKSEDAVEPETADGNDGEANDPVGPMPEPQPAGIDPAPVVAEASDPEPTSTAQVPPVAVPVTVPGPSEETVPLMVAMAKKKPGRSPTKAAAAKATEAKSEKASMSCLDAAAAVLKAEGAPMQCKAMIDKMSKAKLWTSEAPTPAATLYSAIAREIQTKGASSRFRKTERGHFAVNG